VTGSHKEKLIGGVAIVSRVEDAIMAHEGLEIKTVLGMTLDPAEAQNEHSRCDYSVLRLT
jgi:hypothetical protein